MAKLAPTQFYGRGITPPVAKLAPTQFYGRGITPPVAKFAPNGVVTAMG